jgi:hypothetical protein
MNDYSNECVRVATKFHPYDRDLFELNSTASSRTLCDLQEADSPVEPTTFIHVYTTSKRQLVARPGNTDSGESRDLHLRTVTTSKPEAGESELRRRRPNIELLTTNVATARKCRADTSIERQRVGEKAEHDNATKRQVAPD